MKILALEFSSPQRSVAVVSADWRDESRESPNSSGENETLTLLARHPDVTLSEVIETAPGNSMKPLAMVAEALEQAGLEREQIECVAVGLGPGSYAGIRIAIALAQGWQLALAVKLLGISSTTCVAAQVQRDGFTGRFGVVVDAQRDEFYLASYEMSSAGVHQSGPLRLVTSAEVRDRENAGEVLGGPEVTRWFKEGRLVFPRAATLGMLALNRNDFVDGEKLEPIYMREMKFSKTPPPRIVF